METYWQAGSSLYARTSPIILCTGFNENVSEEDAKSKGICEIVLKPVNMKTLSDVVIKAIGEQVGPGYNHNPESEIWVKEPGNGIPGAGQQWGGSPFQQGLPLLIS